MSTRTLRLIATVVVGTALATAAVVAAAPAPGVVVLARPGFPPPLATVEPSGDWRLEAVSTARRAPTYTPRPSVPRPGGAPPTLSGLPFQRAFSQPGTTFALYGRDGASARVLAAIGPAGAIKYAFDFASYGFPPSRPTSFGPQEVVWARQVGDVLVVQTSHLSYARESGNRNGYLTALSLPSGRVLWRSRSLVANAGTFVVVRGLVVSGYGFTAEPDWVYLTDLRTGRVLDRLRIPSAAEEIGRRGSELVVRAYDARVVVRIRPA